MVIFRFSQSCLFLIVTIFITCFVNVFAQTANTRMGIVTDQNGAAVVNAKVTIVKAEAAARRFETTTDEKGIFDTPLSNGGVIIVEAAGFARYAASLSANTAAEIKVVLVPLPANETVTITGTETRLESTAASIVILGSRELDSAAAATLDDRLRQVPGFALFRRAGSRTANPTTQGVSLRGVGASGASRALVLADGVQLNDPFGGWVYWGRVPVEAVRQVEVLRGPASDVYGGSAVGGVVSILTLRPSVEPLVNLETSYGTKQTPMLSGYASAGISKWRGSVAAEFFRTDGFVPVEASQRGPVDTVANVDRATMIPLIEYVFDERRRVFGSAEFYREDRANGTRQQNNDTNLRNFVAGTDWFQKGLGTLTVRGYSGNQNYHQSFSAISLDRQSESLNRLQSVPSQVLGFGSQWAGAFGQNVVTAGLDFRHIRGRSDETVINGGRAVSLVSAGGRETTIGAFGAAMVTVRSRLVLSGGVRFDKWRNSDGYSAARSITSNVASVTDFPNRTESAVSPRAAILVRINQHISLAGTFAKAFRRPTLNELYRAFRVGNVLTIANENLRAERATDGEAAIISEVYHRRLYFRGGYFCTEISQPVSNATLTVTPSLITRQRQNLGRTSSCGIETDLQFHSTNQISFSGGYLFVNSRVASFPTNPALEGLRIPEVAPHQGTVQAEYSNPKLFRTALQIRASSGQFDDDLNQFRLRGYLTVDLFASRALNRKVELFGAVENLFGSAIEAGRTPVLTIASTRAFRVGLRFKLGKK